MGWEVVAAGNCHITLTLTYPISCQLELRSINSINNVATTVLIPFLPALLGLLNASETANRLHIAVFDGIGTRSLEEEARVLFC
jgi:hypothetical protein